MDLVQQNSVQCNYSTLENGAVAVVANNKGIDSTTVWVVGIIVAMFLLGTFLKSNDSSMSSPPYSPTSGKPYDMPQEQWDYVNAQLKREFPSDSRRDIEKASRAIWEFHKQQRGRGEH